jgi:RNA polymerase sigma-70 factor (ECF subfamily)
VGDDTGGSGAGTGAADDGTAAGNAPDGGGMAGDGFEEHRRYLTSVAYRLLGSVADAEDAVQDAWLRWRTVDRAAVEEPRAYLTRVVTRICYDMLGSARARREAYYGEWLPEPVLTDGGADGAAQSPEELAARGESVSFAMLAVMEQLSPAERAAFVLHDVFAVGFEEIAAALEKTPDAARQLASRARRRVREKDGAARRGGPGPVGRAEHRRVVEAFAAATRRGDLPALLTVLAPDVVWHSDGGGKVAGAGVRPIVSVDRVARLVAGLAAKWSIPEIAFEPADVNGDPGLVVRDEHGVLVAVLAFAIAGGRIVEAFALLNPAKLAHLPGGGSLSHRLRPL